MEKKILEAILDIQKDMKDMKTDMKDMKTDIKCMKTDIININNRLDKIEFNVNDGFETLEILSENNSNELTKVKIKVSKLEKRVMEMNVIN